VLPDVLVLTRGGGSADDLAAFSNEHVVRAVAASRIPTLVAIGHEIDLSLAELAADVRASTPSNAAELLVPSKQDVLRQLQDKQQWLQKGLLLQLESAQNWLTSRSEHLESSVQTELKKYQESLLTSARLLEVLSPHAALNRGYALVRSEGKLVRSVTQVGRNQQLSVQLADGTLQVRVE
jgi:exodeoxyribonuclease VII large subunit